MEFPNLILILSLLVSISIQEETMDWRDCHIGEFPSFVNIQLSNEHDRGGSILNKLNILTSVLNFRIEELENYTVIAGDIRTDDSASTSRQVRRVSKFTRHPNFNDTMMKYDIGIITLTKPLELNEFVRAVFIGTESPKIDRKVIVAGWKNIWVGSGWRKICETAVHTIYPKEECKAMIGSMVNVTEFQYVFPDESQFCEGGDVTLKHTTEFKASGGAAYVKGSNQMELVLVGLGSYGDMVTEMAVYAYVTCLKEWIMNEISKIEHRSEVNLLEPSPRADHNAKNRRNNSVNVQIFILPILVSEMLLQFLY